MNTEYFYLIANLTFYFVYAKSNEVLNVISLLKRLIS